MPWMKAPSGAVKEFRDRQVWLREQAGWTVTDAPPPPTPKKPKRRRGSADVASEPTPVPETPVEPNGEPAEPQAPAESGTPEE